MAMDSGFPGGIGYDSDTHRGGTDWNRDGSIDYSDGAHNMLVNEYVRTDGSFGDDAQIALPFRRRNKKKRFPKTRAFAGEHPFLFGCIIGAVVTLLLAIAVFFPMLFPDTKSQGGVAFWMSSLGF